MVASLKTCELLYLRGVLRDTWESKDGEPRQWGRKETPEYGYLVVRLQGKLKDLPLELTEFGWGSCKRWLNESHMSQDEKNLFKEKKRFKHMDHKVKHTITWQRLMALTDDNSSEWESVKLAVKENRKPTRRGDLS